MKRRRRSSRLHGVRGEGRRKGGGPEAKEDIQAVVRIGREEDLLDEMVHVGVAGALKEASNETSSVGGEILLGLLSIRAEDAREEGDHGASESLVAKVDGTGLGEEEGVGGALRVSRREELGAGEGKAGLGRKRRLEGSGKRSLAGLSAKAAAPAAMRSRGRERETRRLLGRGQLRMARRRLGRKMAMGWGRRRSLGSATTRLVMMRRS